MESTDQEDLPQPNMSNLVQVSLGHWQLFLLEEPDLQIDNKPFVALTMMYHSQNHEYIWRALGRIVESGQAQNNEEFLSKCQKLFNSGTPCLGMKAPDSKFPLSCQFSENCSIMIPKSSDHKACQACIRSSEDPLRLWHQIQKIAEDVIYDDAFKTLDALNRNFAKTWSCPICNGEIPLARMKSHLERSHFLSCFVCFHCDDRFVDAKDLCFHTLQEHPLIQELFCPLCPRNVPIKGELNCLANHFRRCYGHKTQVLKEEQIKLQMLECKVCFLRFVSESDLQNHAKECLSPLPGRINVKKAVVTECQPEKDPLDVSSLPEKLLTSSLKKKNDQNVQCKVRCPQCFKEIGAKFLFRHLMFHHRIAEFKCNSCSVVLQTAKELTMHTDDAHPSQRFQICPNCAKQVDISENKQNLIDHVDTCHKIIFLTNMKGKRIPFSGTICSDCGQIFPNKADYEHHECHVRQLTIPTKKGKIGPKSSKQALQPTNEKYFKCGFCFQACKTWKDLVEHHKKSCSAKSGKKDGDIVNPNLTVLTSTEEASETYIDLKFETNESMDPLNIESQNKIFTREYPVNESKPNIGHFREVQEKKQEVPITFSGESSSEKVQCHVCFRKLSSKAMPKHKMFRHQLAQFDCPKCALKFVAAEHISKHVIAHPDISKLHCPNCEQDIVLGNDRKGLEDHFAFCHKLKFRWEEVTQTRVQYIGRECNDCGESFETSEQLVEHETADICAAGPNASELRMKYVENLIDLRNRIRQSVKSEIQAICNDCDERFVGDEKLRFHRKLGHSVTLLCHICAKGFPNRDRLTYHLNRYHPITDEFSCLDCGFIAGNAALLRRHQYTHSPLKLICESCGKKYATETSLKAHTNREHSTSDEFTCKVCGFRAGGASLLKRHQLSHEPPKLMCPTCGKRFARDSHLTLHMRTHTGEKPYKCNLCDYRAAAGSNLSNHRKFVHKINPREKT